MTSTEERLAMQGIVIKDGHFEMPYNQPSGACEWSWNTPPEVVERDNARRAALGLQPATVSPKPREEN